MTILCILLALLVVILFTAYLQVLAQRNYFRDHAAKFYRDLQAYRDPADWWKEE